MYAYIKGKVADIEPDNCVIEANGVGYNIRISPSTAEELPPIGEEVKIYTYTSVKEDEIKLIGFLDQSDLKMFRQLITVNGIGPKGGLSILSVMDADSVRFAILTNDVNGISKAPGVGKKSAERVILELKGRIDADAFLTKPLTASDRELSNGNSAAEGNVREAAEALNALGYSMAEALKAAKKVTVSPDMDVEEILKLALKEMY